MPAAATSAAHSASRVLPAPGSPETSSTRPAPSRAARTAASTAPRSRARPTNAPASSTPTMLPHAGPSHARQIRTHQHAVLSHDLPWRGGQLHPGQFRGCHRHGPRCTPYPQLQIPACAIARGQFESTHPATATQGDAVPVGTFRSPRSVPIWAALPGRSRPRRSARSARGYQELFASLAAGQTRLQPRWPSHQGRIFIHRRSYRERTHLPRWGMCPSDPSAQIWVVGMRVAAL